MRIVIDMQGAIAPSSAIRGVGRYTREMAKAVVAAAAQTGDEVFLVFNVSYPLECDRLFEEFAEILPRERIKTLDFSHCHAPACLTDFAADRPLQERLREWYLHQFGADVIWSTDLQQGWVDDDVITSVKLTEGREIWCTTVHDVTPLLIYGEELYRSRIRDWYFRKLQYAKSSDLIATDSMFSRRMLMDRLDVPEDKIVVVGCAVDANRFFIEDESWRSAKGKCGDILYVGGMDIHKNLITLLEAFSRLDSSLQSRHRLVFAGTARDNPLAISLLAKALELGIAEDRVVILGRIDDAELRRRMGTCSAFVYPSTYEGFGLPPLEAMACAAPVLSSNRSSLPEVVGAEECMFDPEDAAMLAEKLSRVLTDKVFAQRLIDFGVKRAGKFSWAAEAERLMSAWRKAVNDRSGKTYVRYDLRRFSRDLLYSNYPPEVLAAVSSAVAENRLFAKKRIFIDISGVVLVDFCSGIQRVANALANNLAGLAGRDFDLIPVFSDAFCPVFYRAELRNGRYVRGEDRPQDVMTFRDGDILLLADLHPGSIFTKEEILQNLCRRGVQVVTVVYDLIPIDLPGTYPPGFVDGFARYMESVSKFSGILGISKYSADRFEEWCREKGLGHRPGFRTSHFYLGSDILNAVPSRGLPENAEFVLSKMKKRPTFLAVSTIEPRKMHLQMIDAFDELWASGVDANLVFVGRDGWENDTIKKRINEHQENGRRFFWLQGVSDEYLERIYEAADCVVMASKCEGFGLSIIEGAQHGKPLILRDIPVFREVAGEHAFYFTGERGSDLAKCVEEWLTARKGAGVPSSAGIRSCTWRESAEMVLEFFGLKPQG